MFILALSSTIFQVALQFVREEFTTRRVSCADRLARRGLREVKG